MGFEADVFKRLGLSPQPKRPWLGLSATNKWPASSRLAAAAAVAAVVLVGAGAALGVAVSGGKANNVSHPRAGPRHPFSGFQAGLHHRGRAHGVPRQPNVAVHVHQGS